MRIIILAATITGLMTGAAFAQNAQPQTPPTPQPSPARLDPGASKPASEKPIDNGPNTPQANNAYQGGGVVLQGAPGAPAPRPQATPPGQPPQNAVIPK